jgi:hypothetical protein
MLKVLALSVAFVALLAGSTVAQVIQGRIDIDKFTCAQLLATRDDARFRTLVYLNGYINGMRGQKVWNDQTEGERIDRALRECKAAPAKTALEVFAGVWPR